MAGVSVGSALAQPGVPDPSRGRELADTLCSSCHEIEPGSKETLKSDVPPFFSIANRPDQTAERLAGVIILSPHPEMPKAALTTRELREHFLFDVTSRQGLKSLERAQSCHALASDPRCFVRATSSRKREETSRTNDLRITSVRLSPRLLAASSSTSIKERGNDTRIGLLGGKVGFRLCIPHHWSMECAS